jgi:hypothetical protein
MADYSIYTEKYSLPEDGEDKIPDEIFDLFEKL